MDECVASNEYEASRYGRFNCVKCYVRWSKHLTRRTTKPITHIRNEHATVCYMRLFNEFNRFLYHFSLRQSNCGRSCFVISCKICHRKCAIYAKWMSPKRRRNDYTHAIYPNLATRWTIKTNGKQSHEPLNTCKNVQADCMKRKKQRELSLTTESIAMVNVWPRMGESWRSDCTVFGTRWPTGHFDSPSSSSLWSFRERETKATIKLLENCH